MQRDSSQYGETPADAVVFVLLDAFRTDYLQRTRFLSQLADQSLMGSLREPFGFCPRGAYFGGLTMAEQGYTNLFRFDPERSTFRWTRELAGGPRDELVRERMRQQIVEQARAEATPFAAAYVDPLDVPLEWLGYFDLCEREAPWSRAVGYRSLFHILEENDRSWVEVSWPYLNWTGTLTSGRVAGHALNRWTADHSFVFIHLPELDLKGHAFGPGSCEIQTALEDTDRLCELIVNRAASLYRDPAVLFIGDHGMLPVVRRLDVAQPLAETGLRWGHDLAYFIDSTMVRCWFFTEQARHTTLGALRTLDGGHVVTAQEKQRWGLAGIDRRNGEEIFLADPGVLFAPNFFAGKGRPHPRGMHGYAPDVIDNQAIFLAHWPRRTESGSVGTIEARQLFPTFLEWLGLNAPTGGSAVPINGHADTTLRPRWSVDGDAHSDAVVDTHLTTIVSTVCERAPDAEAVILAGGFGRGEGTISTDGTSRRPVNDYDVVVVGTESASLAGLEASLADELEMDFVELWARPTLPVTGKLSQFDYDLRYGSKLLWGDPLAVDRLPRYAPAQVEVDEGIFQIGNRSGGMLAGLTGQPLGTDSRAMFLARQTAKFLIAVADCWLMAHADYHHSYATRRRRFADLAPGCFSPHVLGVIDSAFVSKLTGTSPHRGAEAADPALTVNRALNELEDALGWHAEDEDVIARVLERSAPRRVSGSPRWLEAAEGRGLLVNESARDDTSACVAAVYRACVEGLRRWSDSDTERRLRVVSALSPQFRVSGEPPDPLPAVAQTWLKFFH